MSESPSEIPSEPGESLAEHLAEDTAGERPQDAGEGEVLDLDEELRGRADPPFRTPHPREEP